MCSSNKYPKMTKVRPLVTILNVGKIKYESGLALQTYLTKHQPNEPHTDFRNYLVLQEFHPVFTIGIRTKCYTIKDEQRLLKLGADFYRTNRGGLITFHGPGQLVAYPLLHLKQFNPSMRWYVSTLETMVIKTCREMGLNDATTTKDTGIWVKDRKICAIGVHGGRYITTHGIGFNCCTDLKWFDYIVPCGIEGKGVTSLSQELKREVTVEETSRQLVKTFSTVFQCDVQESPKHVSSDLLKLSLKFCSKNP
ncbi:putative lipoyltransferase 2, mitochondrial [Stomoxys calcitrans]|uniref:Octanoyl-[acyl-carrier-protein]:protein N-octanoyltransferase LIPT2, mitochondrial n=1 Tax=Stomoxys calcitrans TaxID=35570 RepID=A0A1I8PN39_STOCA|nr:putative lipoyltransferase 2, mitochondrial [Stomoxys calcitrans]